MTPASTPRTDPGGTDSNGVEPDDSSILQGGNAPPASNAPPPLPSSAEPNATKTQHTPASDTASNGCSLGGPAGSSHGSSGAAFGLLVAAALVASRRRR
jgi:MYXO-CTERM domain-containing protein